MANAPHPHAAFEAFLEPHVPHLFRLARSLTREQADAEDLVQDTCLKAFRAFHQFRPESNARAWLITILLNTYRDWFRKTLRHPQPWRLEDLAPPSPVTSNPPAQRLFRDPEDVAVHADLVRQVRLALDDLPPEFRLAVLLADVEGCSYQEIAAIVDCPIGTVMSRLHRGRRLLRTTLQALLED